MAVVVAIARVRVVGTGGVEVVLVVTVDFADLGNAHSARTPLASELDLVFEVTCERSPGSGCRDQQKQ